MPVLRREGPLAGRGVLPPGYPASGMRPEEHPPAWLWLVAGSSHNVGISNLLPAERVIRAKRQRQRAGPSGTQRRASGVEVID